MAIQSVYGVIPKVYGKGRAAKQVAEYMKNMRKELQGQEPDIVPQIDAAIVLDRKVCYNKMSFSVLDNRWEFLCSESTSRSYQTHM